MRSSSWKDPLPTLICYMEQQTGSKQGKEYIKAVYCHPDYLTYMQSTSTDMQMTALLWQKPKN